MFPGEPSMSDERSKKGLFPRTRWSLVLAAQDREKNANSEEALAELCRIYWQPLYVYALRLGNTPENAEDLTQGFFARFLQNRSFGNIDQNRGKLRSFLLTAFKNYIHNEWEKDNSHKRGGEVQVFSIDHEKVDQRVRLEFADSNPTPDVAYDRLWVLTLLDHVVEKLRTEDQSLGKRDYFDGLSPFLLDYGESRPYTETASKLGLTEMAVKIAVSRMRKRYRELLLEIVRDTVAGQEDFDGELAYLMSTFQA